ncbi:P-type conjugative transfer protein TrbL [Edaphosphingomonas haloaromaticamans]|uniref:TrbL/VirB6 plasmid conjugal transfer protein n=1 Tax=Edaphosphingomonas haloaromaticamans TaxID=653954 RepID=A0A1S1HCV0_9SPHN|nr:P-type conjugative transfer protein TrbL [Sphingomonas haloaromaticamans]OHT20049.1 TrbL/VirB6 plasmid conjugal transfer protein [Sphingomonas haloaromaticamans]TNE42741.1 MAG: P-type conjugative transfer protein TrbL [Sphingomonadales bacterium]
MNDTGVINTFLDTFNNYIDSGFGLLGGEVAFLSTTLIVIDITLAGLFWAWGADEDVMHRLVKKVLYVGFFAFVIGNFSALAGIVFESFAGLGLKASGSAISLADFMKPGSVAAAGFNAGEPLLDAAGELTGPVGLFTNFVQIAILLIAWVIILIAFFIISVQLFVTLIEFKLTTLAGFVLLPFALFNKTAFLAEKVLGNVVASGIKVLVLAVIVGIGTGLFAQFESAFGEMPTAEQAMSVALAALALLGLSIFGPGIATGLVSGAPQLGAGAAVGTALAVSGMAVGGAMGARMAAGGAASAIGGGMKAGAAAARGGSFAAGAAASSYSLGSLGKSGAGAVADGLSAVGQSAASGAARAAIDPIRNAAAKAGQSMKSNFRSGARAGFSASGGTISGGSGGSGGASVASTSAPATSGGGAPPAWAKAMKRQQAMQRGVTSVSHAVRSGDRGGGGMSPDIKQKD